VSGRMKAVVWQAPWRVTVESVPIPEIGPKDLLIKIKACGICGSDVHSFKLGFYIDPGQVPGHEWAGEVVEMGPEVEGVEVGERVTGFKPGNCGECYWCKLGEIRYCPEYYRQSNGFGKPGAMAEYMRFHNPVVGRSLHKLPSEIDDEVGATVEPTSAADTATADVKPGDKVVVLGAGILGNVSMQFAKARGAAKVVVCETSPLRLQKASELGADAVFDARTGDSLEWVKQQVGVGRYHFHEGAMADVVIDAAGVPATVVNALEMVRSLGTVVYAGLPEETALVDTTKIIHKHLRITPVLGGRMALGVQHLAAGTVDTRPLITHRFPLDEAQRAFEVQSNPEECVKVIFKM
jgi:threonine dehydrogenase-like Zn-dependent dehydrogenase